MKYECSVCGYVYDEAAEGTPWNELPEDWECPICSADRSFFKAHEEEAPAASDDVFPTSEAPAEVPSDEGLQSYLEPWRRSTDDLEQAFAAVQEMSISGHSAIEPMRTRKPVVSWDEILILGAQLATLPRNESEPVLTQTVIGPKSAKPLVIEIPIYVSHMSFGALSREAKIALAAGSAEVGTATCSGEGGIVPEAMAAAHRYIFEYVPNRYSVTDDNLRTADAIEIKIGQSAKPGMGGHLPGAKVTDEIAEVRGFPAGQDIISPAHFPDITTPAELRQKVDWLREASGGKPIGVKLAAGHLEADLEIAVAAGPDFITIDGRPGATGAAPKSVKDATSIPTIYALSRARRFLDANGADGISLVITGGFRLPSDAVKALAMGADAVAIATAALVAIGCQQYRICNTGKCPVGIATQDPALRARLDVETSAQRVANFLRAATAEFEDFARLAGRHDIHHLDLGDLRTTNSDIARYTGIAHVGEPENTDRG
jgi:glutamate synthase domain-containing protein 2/rubredoxin